MNGIIPNSSKERDMAIQLFAGNSNPELAQNIAKYIGHSLGDCEVGKFSNGETSVTIKESS